MKITLNGGNFGGVEVEVKDGTDIIEMTDDNGVWLYSAARNQGTATAEFVGMKQAAN